MKTAQLISILFVALAPFTLLSCTGDSKKNCGGEDNEKYVAFPYITPAVFNQHRTPQDAGDVIYKTNYNSNGVYAGFSFLMEIKSVCPYEDVLVSTTLVLKHADAGLTDSVSMTSVHGNLVTEGVNASANGVLYDIDVIYPFNADAPSPVTLTIANQIKIPAQGSWSADSAYFFSNLDSYAIGGKYKKAQ